MGLTSEIYRAKLPFEVPVFSNLNIPSAIWTMPYSKWNVIVYHDCQRYAEEIMAVFVVITAPADGLALLCASISADTVMTKVWYLIYSELKLEI